MNKTKRTTVYEIGSPLYCTVRCMCTQDLPQQVEQMHH